MSSTISPMPETEATPAPEAGERRGLLTRRPKKNRETASFWQRYSRNKGSIIGLGIVIFLAILSFFPMVFESHDPDEQDLTHRLVAMGTSGHLLGTDSLGRDLYSRLIDGVGVTMQAALLAVAVAVVIGVPAGLYAGYRNGGKVDQLFSAISDGTMSIPAILAVIAVVSALGPGIDNAMITVGVFLSARLFRIQRATTIATRHETYIEGSEAIGCSTPRILFRHVLPNSLSPTIVQITLIFGSGILSESALSFIGLGVQRPQSSLGSLIADAAPRINQYPFMIAPPGILCGLAVLAFALCGEGLKDSLGGRAPTK